MIFLLKFLYSFYDYLMAFFNKSNFHLGGFLGCYSFMNKFLLCFIRRIKNDDAAINSFFSGAIAGFFSLQLQPKSSWALWRVSVWARVFVNFKFKTKF